VLRCCFAWSRPSLHRFAIPLIFFTCSPFTVRPKPDTGTVVREYGQNQIALLKLSPTCPRETSPLPSAQPPGALSLTGRTCTLNGKVGNKAALTKRTDPPPTSEEDSLSSHRRDEAGVAFKSTRDADDNDNDDDAYKRPRDDDAGARSTGSEKATAPGGNPTRPDTRRPIPDARYPMPDTPMPDSRCPIPNV
jgi:hypothetical protein